MRRLAALALALLALSSTGCGALIDAGFRELDDHGSHARYRHQSYGAHVVDALLEEEDDDCEPPPCRTEVRVYVDHRRR